MRRSNVLTLSLALLLVGFLAGSAQAQFPGAGAGFAPDAPATIFTQVAYSDEGGRLIMYHVLRPGPFFTHTATGVVYRFKDEKNPLAYKHYRAQEKVGGKSMEEHLRFSVVFWHTFRGTGSDPFGGAVYDRPWDEASDADKYIVFDSPADGGVRMAHETVSAAQLVAEVQNDASFESGAARCEMLDRLADWYDSIEVLTETGAVKLACAASSPTQSASAGGE